MMRSWVVLLLLSVCAADSYKFLVYSPVFGYSPMHFMGAIADTLTEAGHDVTMLMPILNVDEQHKTGVKLTKKIIKTPTEPRAYEMMRYKNDLLSKIWTMQPSVMTLLQMTDNMTLAFTYQCEALLSDDKLLKQLADEKFDVGISEAFTICGLGLFEVLKIPASIAATSTVHLDCILHSIGEPITPSYVPGAMSSMGDRMGFIDRIRNVVDVVLGQKFISMTYVKEIQVFRAKFGPNFKGYEELLADSSYVLTNSNPYLDYPRPMLHKTVPVGGVAVNVDPKENVLPKEWDSILNERNTTVYVSFGSVTKSVYMPDIYRNTLLEVFDSMPNTTFIWKYEEEGSTLAAHLKNVHLSTWVPQNALLGDRRLTAFITHGGLGSVTELAHMGKPAVLVPIFADQARNAHMLSKHGGSIVLKKNDLENPQRLRDALNSIFSDASYSHSAKRLSEMLLNQPISAKQLLELIADASYVFTSSNPYLDYPRPMLHKTVPIGGIAVSIDSKQNALSKEWDSVLNERNTTVLVSFGTMAKSIYMLDLYRFGRLPNLDPYGRHLSYIEYFLIDIVLVFASVLVIISFIVVKIFRKCFSRSTKNKKD